VLELLELRKLRKLRALVADSASERWMLVEGRRTVREIVVGLIELGDDRSVIELLWVWQLVQVYSMAE
jgi:hypothetical protein